MKYTVMTPDGLSVAFFDAPTPGSAAKNAVEEGRFRAGRLLVFDDIGACGTWEVSETRVVYAYEVKSDL